MDSGAILTPKIRLGLAVKLAVLLVCGVALLFGAWGYWNLRLQRKESEAMVLQSADRISDVIQRSTRYQMLHNDRNALYEVIRNIGSEPGLERIRIFNPEGRVSFSTDAAETGSMVNKSAEACYACHSTTAPLVRLKRPDRARIFSPQGDGRRVLAVIRPIENEPSCSSAPCHAHSPKQQVLGVIDTHLTLDAVDQQIAGHQTMLARSTLLAAILVSAVSTLFIWIVVHKPIRALMAGTHRVAGGDLNYRIPVSSHDELGDLAVSFNKMTSELKLAYARVEQRAEHLESQVEKTESYLMGSERLASLGKLAATVAHEVNNPLFGIMTYAKLCRKEVDKAGLPDDVRGSLATQLDVIERESHRCGQLMRNLLTFAREARPRREPVALNDLVGRAVALVRHQAELQQTELSLNLAVDLPEIEANPGQIQQVILVLLMNAIEALSASGPGGRIEIRTGYGEGQVHLRVADDGPGIPPDVMNSIFEPFFTTKEEAQRTGMGLAVARSIVEQHGGSIEVASEPGQGARFTVTLPLEPPQRQEIVNERSESPEPSVHG